MPRYFMGDTRLAGLMGPPRGLPRGERRSSTVSAPCRLRQGAGYGVCDDEMMDPSRPAPSRIGPRRQSDDAQRIQAEGRPLKVRGTAACGRTRARKEPVQRTSAERHRPEEEFPRG